MLSGVWPGFLCDMLLQSVRYGTLAREDQDRGGSSHSRNSVNAVGGPCFLPSELSTISRRFRRAVVAAQDAQKLEPSNFLRFVQSLGFNELRLSGPKENSGLGTMRSRCSQRGSTHLRCLTCLARLPTLARVTRFSDERLSTRWLPTLGNVPSAAALADIHPNPEHRSDRRRNKNASESAMLTVACPTGRI
ncbi:hypothetical protein VTK56DRAFT_8034 [Thermocarpiscus australiensis]